jgi:prepilin signal peptidase PulO-like enzyme (type II secretory pathway)
MEIFFVSFLFVFGAAIGSFVGALIWRLHDLRDNPSARSRKMWRGFWGFRTEFLRKNQRKNAAREQRKLPTKYQHSYCETCGHKLAAPDLVPILSYAFAKGKCRYCGSAIGISALFIELAGGAIFAISYLLWPISHADFSRNHSALDIALFALWLAISVLFLALFFYDARWKKLPNFFMYPLIVLAVIFAILNFFARGNSAIPGSFFANFALTLIPVFGVYLLLFLVSAGKWIGLGDVKFGLAVALILPDWRLAVMVLVFANFAGTLFVLPGLFSRKLSRNSQIAFGPFLIAATFFVALFAKPLLEFFANFLLI